MNADRSPLAMRDGMMGDAEAGVRDGPGDGVQRPVPHRQLRRPAVQAGHDRATVAGGVRVGVK